MADEYRRTAAVGAHAAGARGRASPLVLNKRTLGWITDYVSSIVESKTPLWWWACMAVTTPLALCSVLPASATSISTGVGVWGNNHPVGWAWDITNFVFWIGIGHAGTLISAILFLTRQKWRTSINRAAEAMTIFAVMCAGIFPGIPRRPRLDGVVPRPGPERQRDLAELPLPAALGRVRGLDLLHGLGALLVHRPDPRPRDAARPRDDEDPASSLYGIFALGWRGGNRHWQHYEMAYLLLAGLSTPLVLSVHSVVSFDFATSSSPAGTRRSSRLTSSPARSSAASRWCSRS